MTDSLFGARQTAFVNGERVRQARELIGATQSELGRKIGITQAMVAHIEGGFKQPSDEVLSAIAQITNLPVHFFFKGVLPDLPAGWALYRARAGTSRKKLQRTHRHAQLILEIALALSTKVRTIPVRISTSSEPPEDAAAQMRKVLGCRLNDPVAHLIRSIEKAGAIVLGLPSDDATDAFAVWAGGLPVIAVSDSSAGDRVRFTVAHELGHLVMHHLKGSDAELEAQAYRFAAELLTPASAVLSDFEKVGLSLQGFAQLKLRWGVSMQMLIRRARDLDLITDRQYHYLMQQLSARGWRTSEPSNLAIPVERPRLLRRMAELVYGDPIDYSTMAKDFGLKVEFLVAVMNRYAGPAAGKASDAAKVIRFARKRPV